jgi:hypothetical protein
MWRTSAVFVIPFAMYCSFCFQKYIFLRARSPHLHQLREKIASCFQCEIINVHAGAENRTAIHLHPFQALCQPQIFGFHRFFQVFSGFVRIRALFIPKIPAKSSFLLLQRSRLMPILSKHQVRNIPLSVFDKLNLSVKRGREELRL